jgi:hypothetical protein
VTRCAAAYARRASSPGLVVHLVALTGFKNRISVLFNWTLAFLSDGRPQRVITKQQVFARQALEARTFVTRTERPS